MSTFYTLEIRKAVLCDLHTWVAMMNEIGARRVAETVIGDIRVSTVLLGLDHSVGGGPPLLFESMAFGLPGDDEWQERCTTWEEADAIHAAMCKRARAL